MCKSTSCSLFDQNMGWQPDNWGHKTANTISMEVCYPHRTTQTGGGSGIAGPFAQLACMWRYLRGCISAATGLTAADMLPIACCRWHIAELQPCRRALLLLLTLSVFSPAATAVYVNYCKVLLLLLLLLQMLTLLTTSTESMHWQHCTWLHRAIDFHVC